MKAKGNSFLRKNQWWKYVISAVVISRKNTLQMVAENPFRKKLCAWVVFIFVWSVISFSQVSTFIYFNF